jgi:hypothetical protein
MRAARSLDPEVRAQARLHATQVDPATRRLIETLRPHLERFLPTLQG